MQLQHAKALCPYHRGTVIGIQGNKGLGSSSADASTSHPGDKCLQRDVHPNLATTTINRFLNVRNETALQLDCSLTYSGHNIYSTTSLYQALLQGHILTIPYPYAPTGLSPLLTLPPSAGLANDQHQGMQIQFLLAMWQYRLSKEEAIELLYQRVHMVTTSQ